MLKDDSSLYSKQRAEWKQINHYHRKTVSVSVKVILFHKNLKDKIKLQKKIWIARQNTLQGYLVLSSEFEYKFKDLTNKDFNKY